MLGLVRRILAVVVAVALITGTTLAVATPVASAAEPCPHEFGQDADHHHQHHHNTGAIDCLGCCCIGICATVPNLPVALMVVPTVVTAVAYWSPAGFCAGRSIAPDLGPPKPIA